MITMSRLEPYDTVSSISLGLIGFRLNPIKLYYFVIFVVPRETIFIT